MGKVPRGHAARQASQKHLIKAHQSPNGLGSGLPKFFKQIGKASAAPKAKKEVK